MTEGNKTEVSHIHRWEHLGSDLFQCAICKKVSWGAYTQTQNERKIQSSQNSLPPKG